MTAASGFLVGQTVVFLAVCGFGLWAARIIVEAAENSALAAERAVKAASDAESTATDIREMRNMLQTWLDEQRTRADLSPQQQTPEGPLPAGRVETDTAEAQAVLTPQAIINRDHIKSAEIPPRDSFRSHRGRHAVSADPSWTSALRAAASRGNWDKRPARGDRPAG